MQFRFAVPGGTRVSVINVQDPLQRGAVLRLARGREFPAVLHCLHALGAHERRRLRPRPLLGKHPL